MRLLGNNAVGYASRNLRLGALSRASYSFAALGTTNSPLEHVPARSAAMRMLRFQPFARDPRWLRLQYPSDGRIGSGERNAIQAEHNGAAELGAPAETEGSLRGVAARSCLPRKLPLPGTFAQGNGPKKKGGRHFGRDDRWLLVAVMLESTGPRDPLRRLNGKKRSLPGCLMPRGLGFATKSKKLGPCAALPGLRIIS
jgi:hypothetical protein